MSYTNVGLNSLRVRFRGVVTDIKKEPMRVGYSRILIQCRPPFSMNMRCSTNTAISHQDLLDTKHLFESTPRETHFIRWRPAQLAPVECDAVSGVVGPPVALAFNSEF